MSECMQIIPWFLGRKVKSGQGQQVNPSACLWQRLSRASSGAATGWWRAGACAKQIQRKMKVQKTREKRKYRRTGRGGRLPVPYQLPGGRYCGQESTGLPPGCLHGVWVACRRPWASCCAGPTPRVGAQWLADWLAGWLAGLLAG